MHYTHAESRPHTFSPARTTTSDGCSERIGHDRARQLLIRGCARTCAPFAPLLAQIAFLASAAARFFAADERAYLHAHRPKLAELYS